MTTQTLKSFKKQWMNQTKFNGAILSDSSKYRSKIGLFLLKIAFLGLIILGVLFPKSTLQAQTVKSKLFSLVPADSLNKKRLRTGIGVGVVGYGAAMTGLYKAWYADYPSSPFHTYNDIRDWNQMDKMGHWLMSYNEARWAWMCARWTGMRPKSAAWAGFAAGQLIQTSFEMFDGFSTQWGFSVWDIGFNTLGSGLFLGQQLGWHEQRISMKMSALPVKYSNTPIIGSDGSTTTLKERADQLYGTSPIDFVLKNYNTLAVWMSVNPRSFMAKDANTWIPPWLNIAVGMGADNLFAGHGYSWEKEKDCINCPVYTANPLLYPRTRQFFLSLDVDTSRIKVKNRFLRTLLSAANIIKIPAPTLMWNNQGKVRFYPIYF
jgi:hypothetical protein